MIPLAWDTETERFRPGVMAPELVCVTWQRPGLESRIAPWNDAHTRFRTWLTDPETILVGHGLSYDTCVVCANFPDLIPLVFAAYEADRITDTLIRQKILDIAEGNYRGGPDRDGVWRKYNYALADLGWRFLGKQRQGKKSKGPDGEDDEDTAIQTTFGGLRSVPFEQWPEEHKRYALEDTEDVLKIYQLQEKHADFLGDQFRQTRYDFWLRLASVWGLRTSPEAVEALRVEVERAYEDLKAELVAEGLVNPKKGSKNTKVAKERMATAMAALGKKPRVTKTGEISLDADACAASEDPVLESYAELTTLRTMLSKDISALRQGVIYPIHTTFDLAKTTRTTSRKPNVQNWRKVAEIGDGEDKKKFPGARDCFIPRPGRVFAQADFDGFELRGLAQICTWLFGTSELAAALNAGMDPHTALACEILGGVPYEVGAKRKEDESDREFDDARQTAKVANFGLPGGLGIEKFVLFARKQYGVILTPDQARDLKARWLARWPEMRRYFDYINRLCSNPENLALVEHPFVGRLQGGCTYTEACNTYFQSLCATAAKEAGWEIAKACYVDRSSPLFGSRIVNFVHDEFILETDEGPGAHDAAMELAALMKRGANKYLPDVPAKTKPLLMRRWSKKAKAVFGSDGRLLPWE